MDVEPVQHEERSSSYIAARRRGGLTCALGNEHTLLYMCTTSSGTHIQQCSIDLDAMDAVSHDYVGLPAYFYLCSPLIQ